MTWVYYIVVGAFLKWGGGEGRPDPRDSQYFITFIAPTSVNYKGAPSQLLLSSSMRSSRHPLHFA